jgi:hypothetical protein
MGYRSVRRPQRIVVASLLDEVQGVIRTGERKIACRDVAGVDQPTRRQLEHLGDVDGRTTRYSEEPE